MKVRGRRRRRTVIALVLVGLLAVIIAAAVAFYRRHSWLGKHRCIGNTKTLSFCLWRCWGDDREFPDNLNKLLFVCVDSGSCICPSAGRAVRLLLPDGVKASSPQGQRIVDGFGPKHTDYGFVTGLNLDVKPERKFDEEGNHVATIYPPRVETWDPHVRDWLFVFEKEGNHDGKRNVALLDCSVGSLTEAQFKECLERTLREARAAGFDAKVWGYAPGEAPRWLDDLNRAPTAPDE
ncbi:MAG: hypothetical protein ACYSU0_17460 [Planctomycetota bacterium]